MTNLQTCCSGSSPYKTDDFNNGEIQNFPIRRDGDPKQFQIQEYVQILCDTLRMKKNLCLCRNFQRLDKNFISMLVGYLILFLKAHFNANFEM